MSIRSTRFRLHVGIEGGREEGGREVEKGVDGDGGKVAVGVLSDRSDAFLLVRLPSLASNLPQARDHHVSSHLQNTFYTANTLLPYSLMSRYALFRRRQGVLSSSSGGR